MVPILDSQRLHLLLFPIVVPEENQRLMIRNLILRKYSLKCIVDRYPIEADNFRFQCFQHFLPLLLAYEMEILAPRFPNPLLCILRTTAKPSRGCPLAPLM